MKIFLRILLDLFLFASAVSLPWWFTFILAAVLIIKLEFYYESLFAGFVIDAIYGSRVNYLLNFQLVFTFLFSAEFIFMEWFKKRLRFYNE